MTNGCEKWPCLSDCWFRKVTEIVRRSLHDSDITPRRNSGTTIPPWTGCVRGATVWWPCTDRQAWLRRWNGSSTDPPQDGEHARSGTLHDSWLWLCVYGWMRRKIVQCFGYVTAAISPFILLGATTKPTKGTTFHYISHCSSILQIYRLPPCPARSKLLVSHSS